MYNYFSYDSNIVDWMNNHLGDYHYTNNQRRKASNKKKPTQHVTSQHDKKDILDIHDLFNESNESKPGNHKYDTGTYVVICDNDNEYYLYCGTITKLLSSVYNDVPLYEVEFLGSFGYNDINKSGATEKHVFRESQLLLFSNVDVDVLESETKRCKELAEQVNAIKQDVSDLRNSINNICNTISKPYNPLSITPNGDLSTVRSDIDCTSGDVALTKSDISLVDDRVTYVDERAKNLEGKVVDIENKVVDIERKQKKTSKIAKFALLSKFF